MKKKYRVRHNSQDDYLLPWVVSQWYPYNRHQKRFGRWCVIAKFYRRGDARLLIGELKEKQRKPGETIHRKLVKENPLWPSSAKLQEISRNLANARRMQGWT